MRVGCALTEILGGDRRAGGALGSVADLVGGGHREGVGGGSLQASHKVGGGRGALDNGHLFVGSATARGVDGIAEDRFAAVARWRNPCDSDTARRRCRRRQRGRRAGGNRRCGNRGGGLRERQCARSGEEQKRAGGRRA
jgi:hypothetical protein